ncbi:hypothetical protein [Microbacterium sp. CGR2]|uniref:hypothetical protein n=2 Tax=unclassified Microbacterium TaxID=2609290 RepID=UPI0011C48EF4|nr:hypothetical protein [Microbacterium sp. CGR2]
MPESWSTADDWFTEFITNLEASPRRRNKLWRERIEVPVKVALARAYTDKTEQLRRYLAAEREKDIA